MLVYEAGRELDRELALAFEYEVITEHEDLRRGQTCQHEKGSIALYGLKYILRLPGGKSVSWAPSTSWEGMRLVVEEMQKRGYLIEVDQFQWDLYNVRWRHAATGAWTRWMRFESLPHAVAIATLSALRGENRDVEAEF